MAASVPTMSVQGLSALTEEERNRILGKLRNETPLDSGAAPTAVSGDLSQASKDTISAADAAQMDAAKKAAASKSLSEKQSVGDTTPTVISGDFSEASKKLMAQSEENERQFNEAQKVLNDKRNNKSGVKGKYDRYSNKTSGNVTGTYGVLGVAPTTTKKLLGS